MGAARYFSLIRPVNCFMAAFATLVGYWVALGTTALGLQLLLAMCAAFLVCGAGQAINDYFDAETDSRIRPKKPIPSGAVSKRSALYLAIALFIAGNLAAAGINPVALGIAVAFTLLLIVYSALLRSYKYIGNWVVAAGMAFTLVFGASIVGNYTAVFWLAAAALLAGVPREIIKDVEDLEADVEKVSLPMVAGERASVAAVFLLYAASVACALYAYFAGIFGGCLYITFVAITAVIFAHSALLAARRREHKAQGFSKLGMVVALLAFLAGVFE